MLKNTGSIACAGPLLWRGELSLRYYGWVCLSHASSWGRARPDRVGLGLALASLLDGPSHAWLSSSSPSDLSSQQSAPQ